MSEQENNAADQAQATSQSNQPAPVFRLQKMYLKDLSFENPAAPDVFLERDSDPKVDVQLKLENRKLVADDNYEVVLAITAKVINNKNGKTMFIIELEHAGVFLLQNIPEQYLETVLAVECPTLLFPFTRQIISQTTVDGGFVPFMMDPVNFMALYENTKRQQQQEEQQKA